MPSIWQRQKFVLLSQSTTQKQPNLATLPVPPPNFCSFWLSWSWFLSCVFPVLFWNCATCCFSVPGFCSLCYSSIWTLPFFALCRSPICCYFVFCLFDSVLALGFCVYFSFVWTKLTFCSPILPPVCCLHLGPHLICQIITWRGWDRDTIRSMTRHRTINKILKLLF